MICDYSSSVVNAKIPNNRYGYYLTLLLNLLTRYLLQKSFFERCVFLMLFVIAIYVFATYFDNKEQIVAQQYQTNVVAMQKEIQKLMLEYKIESYCAKSLCNAKEMQGIYKHFKDKALFQNIGDQNAIQYSHLLYISCQNLACYEFVRELESLASIFITEIYSFNIEFLQTSSPNPNKSTDLKPLAFERLLSSHTDSAVLKSPTTLPLEWKQDMIILFEIQKI